MKSGASLVLKCFAGRQSVQQRRTRVYFLYVLYCLLIVLCSMAHALLESGGPLVRSSQIDTSRTIVNEGSASFDPDRVAWEFILSKYSSSGKVLTEEEFERMVRSMQKCQQTRSLEEDVKHAKPIASSFAVGMDSSSDEFAKVSNCKGVMDSMKRSKSFYATNYAYFNETSFGQICQRLLFYIENPECCERSTTTLANPQAHDSEEAIPFSAVLSESRNAVKKDKPSSSEVWGYGFLLVTIISLSSLVGVSLMPFMAKDFYKHLLTVMIGLAVGSLTGSAVFHLIPQALRLNENDPNHEYLHIGLVISGGIWLFFMVERILKFIMDYKERKGKNWKREKMSSVISGTPESSSIAVMTENGNLMKGSLVEGSGEQRNSLIFPSAPRDTGVIYECQEQAIKASFGHQEKPRLSSCHDHQVTFEQGKDSVIATVAWMIIFGDGLHNFIDGLSIGAAFNESIWTGVSISVAVLCEELPHELGDFAVLLNAGMSMRQAVTYNFLSACTCYIGMAVGILLGEIEASSYIFALAGGMFLYISLVDMVPEMNEIAQETSKISVKKGLITLFLQNLGLFAGITTLYLLARYQDSFQF